MNDEPSSTPDKANLDIDLSQLFLPSWAKEADAPARLSKMAEKYGNDDRREPFGNQRNDRGPGKGGPNRRPPQGGVGGGGNRSERRPERRDDRRNDRSEERRPERAPEPVLNGWNLQFHADPRGIEGLSKQVRASAKTHPLFDLARVVLEKPERYSIEFKRGTPPTPALFQMTEDGSLWLSENEAVTHVLNTQFEKFYRKERVTVDAPKGDFPFVAQCGMSGVLLGPPNFHDYQTKLRQLHAERYAGLPFEVYKSRIKIVKDEASIQKWKEEQSSKDEFYPAETPEGAEPVKLETLADVEKHFKQNHAATLVAPVAERVIVPGNAALYAGSHAIRTLARRVLEELRRFPLPLANTLGQGLASKGLQIFKAHENITYVSGARPKYLDRVATPVADSLCGILNYLEAHPRTPRNDQWKALVALRPAAAEGEDVEAALAKDLSWLLREGYVTDFAKRSLEATRKPQPRPEKQPQTPKAKKPKAPKPDEVPKPAEAGVPIEATTTPEPQESPVEPVAVVEQTPAPVVEEPVIEKTSGTFVPEVGGTNTEPTV
jgi:hypothetical protein